MFSQGIEDIRDRQYLTHKDILRLNFIKDSGSYIYRRHYRQGLRSHIMEVLTQEAVKNETNGVFMDGLRSFPRAKPSMMLRIFRARFGGLKDAKEELKRVRIIGEYLLPDNIAISKEILVDYKRHKDSELLLCGLQEYVKGQVLDPWGILDETYLLSLSCQMGIKKMDGSASPCGRWIQDVREKGGKFISKLKKMMIEANHVPDLAGVGNLILASSGYIKLVDINNISKVSFDSVISLDDRGYPVCDKSIEALSLLEQKLLVRAIQRNDPVYKIYLDPSRMSDVNAMEREFRLSIEHKGDQCVSG
ncbi:hypothetical protein JXL19_08115 [bacterium]|nr:hypothetical protein [bacterium]